MLTSWLSGFHRRSVPAVTAIWPMQATNKSSTSCTGGVSGCSCKEAGGSAVSCETMGFKRTCTKINLHQLKENTNQEINGEKNQRSIFMILAATCASFTVDINTSGSNTWKIDETITHNLHGEQKFKWKKNVKVLYSYTIKTKIIFLIFRKSKQSIGRSRECLQELHKENNSNLEVTVVPLHKRSVKYFLLRNRLYI